MERLTKRTSDGQAVMDCKKCKADWTEKQGESMEECTALYCRNRLKDRVAAYEDTGLMPEEINDLASVREISPEAEYAINKHADSIIERLDKLLAQTDDDDRLRELAEADRDGRVVVLPCKVRDVVYGFHGEKTILPMVHCSPIHSDGPKVLSVFRFWQDRIPDPRGGEESIGGDEG